MATLGVLERLETLSIRPKIPEILGGGANGTDIMGLLKFTREQITHLLTEWIFGTTKEVHLGDNQRCTYGVFQVLRSAIPRPL